MGRRIFLQEVLQVTQAKFKEPKYGQAIHFGHMDSLYKLLHVFVSLSYIIFPKITFFRLSIYKSIYNITTILNAIWFVIGESKYYFTNPISEPRMLIAHLDLKLFYLKL